MSRMPARAWPVASSIPTVVIGTLLTPWLTKRSSMQRRAPLKLVEVRRTWVLGCTLT